jgi:hypothetical protein
MRRVLKRFFVRQFHYTISATLRTMGGLLTGLEDSSVSPPMLIPPKHGLQNPITSSRIEVGKHTLAKGESQSGRNLGSATFRAFDPKTSITPANAADPGISASPPFNRSMCVILDVTTPAWSIIMQDVNKPNKMASTISPRI